MAIKGGRGGFKRFDGRQTDARMSSAGMLTIPGEEVRGFLTSRGVMDSRGVRADAGESAFTALALSYVDPMLYETMVPPCEGRIYVPVSNKSQPGSISTRFRMFTRTGVANMVGNATNDFPRVGFFVKEYAHNFYRFGVSFAYTLFDLAAAAVAAANGGPPVNIDLEDGIAAKEATERRIDLITAFGSNVPAAFPGMPNVGLVGLLNLPNANTYVPANGMSGSSQWSTKTPDEIIADLTGIIAAQVAATFKRFRPSQILLPITQHETIAGRSMGDGRSDTILSYFVRTRQESGHPIKVDSWQYCMNPFGEGDMMAAYTPEERYVRHEISREFTQSPPSQRGFKVEVECAVESAGVVSPYPLSVSLATGI